MLHSTLGHFLHIVNVKVSLQSRYSTHWELCKVVAIGARDSTWVVLAFWKFSKATRTECVVAWQELGFMVIAIIGLSTDATVQKFIWVGNAYSARWRTRIEICHICPNACNMGKCFIEIWMVMMMTMMMTTTMMMMVVVMMIHWFLAYRNDTYRNSCRKTRNCNRWCLAYVDIYRSNTLHMIRGSANLSYPCFNFAKQYTL